MRVRLIAATATLVVASYPFAVQARGPRTVAEVLSDLTPQRRIALSDRFRAADVSYPPQRLSLIAYKKERVLEVWAPKDGQWRLITSYPVLAASGEAGPKLRQGDYQVPEGVYKLTALNPNSNYHLSIRVDYPNARDRAWAARDGRQQLGGDIYIHGKAASVGCIAIGDPAIEQLFTLVADTGLNNSQIVIAPNRRLSGLPAQPGWLPELYQEVRQALLRFGTGDLNALATGN